MLFSTNIAIFQQFFGIFWDFFKKVYIQVILLFFWEFFDKIFI
jgi:hypothetical protein